MNRNARTALVLGVALLFASVASFLVYRAVQQIPVREVEVAQVFTIVAARPITVGTMLTPDDLKRVPWPGRNQVEGANENIDDVVSRGVIVDIAENEPITENKLAPKEAGAGLAPVIPSGMRAVSVRVNDVIAVAGFAIPGSRVDLLVTIDDPNGGQPITRAVVSNIQVLTAGTEFDQERSRREGTPIRTAVVTLLATPADAEKITLATMEGRVTLTLRNPLDIDPTETEGARLAGLMGEPAPPPVVRPVQGRPRVVAPPPPPPPPKVYTVETIRAAQRREEPVR
ncbi:MAG: Flp pilus assembly protein CpaB [Vicinamibacterales bacterium]